jgi:N-sulfoglucosamine sulfohydrolase
VVSIVTLSEFCLIIHGILHCLLNQIISFGWLGLVALKQADAAKKPNILWIVGENFSLDLACYGQKNVSTPNIDRLAREGTRYTKVYSTSPVCAPSRSALMTGWYATTTDMHHMRSHRTDGFRLPAITRRTSRISASAWWARANWI